MSGWVGSIGNSCGMRGGGRGARYQPSDRGEREQIGLLLMRNGEDSDNDPGVRSDKLEPQSRSDEEVALIDHRAHLCEPFRIPFTFGLATDEIENSGRLEHSQGRFVRLGGLDECLNASVDRSLPSIQPCRLSHRICSKVLDTS